MLLEAGSIVLACGSEGSYMNYENEPDYFRRAEAAEY